MCPAGDGHDHLRGTALPKYRARIVALMEVGGVYQLIAGDDSGVCSAGKPVVHIQVGAIYLADPATISAAGMNQRNI